MKTATQDSYAQLKEHLASWKGNSNAPQADKSAREYFALVAQETLLPELQKLAHILEKGVLNAKSSPAMRTRSKSASEWRHFMQYSACYRQIVQRAFGPSLLEASDRTTILNGSFPITRSTTADWSESSNPSCCSC